MASNYELRKALYKQIKSKDLSVIIAANKFFRLVKLDDDTFLLNIDIQTDKGNITIKGLTKNNVNSYNTTSDIELLVSADNIVYVKNTSATETFTITSTSIELAKGILNESYFDSVTTNDGAVRIFDSEEDKGAFNGVVGSSSRINSDVSSFSDRLYVNGPSVLNDTLEVNGLTTLHNKTDIVGPLEVTEATTLNGSLSVTGVNNTISLAGPTTISNDLTVSGATELLDSLTVNGNKPTNLGGTLTVTEATELLDSLTVNGNASEKLLTLQSDGTTRWTVGSDGVLESVGTQTIRTTTGDLTLTSLDGNGNINLNPNGTGIVNISKDTTISGKANLNSLEVENNSLFKGDVDIKGTLNVDSAVTLGDTLDVAGDITFGTQANKATLTYTTDTAITFTIPDTGADSDFVMTEGNQTIAGIKTFTSSPVVPAPTDVTSAVNKEYVISQITNLQTELDGKQPLDADLTSIAALTGTSGLLRKTAANTWGLDNTSYEVTSNKVNIIRPSKTTTNEELATNDKYPSELAIAKRLDDIDDLLDDIDGEGGELGSLNSRVTTLEDGKQDKLIAGDNINIVDNTISVDYDDSKTTDYVYTSDILLLDGLNLANNVDLQNVVDTLHPEEIITISNIKIGHGMRLRINRPNGGYTEYGVATIIGFNEDETAIEIIVKKFSGSLLNSQSQFLVIGTIIKHPDYPSNVYVNTTAGNFSLSNFEAALAANVIRPLLTNLVEADIPSLAISKITNLQTTLDGKEPAITAGTTAQYWRGDKTWQTLNKTAVGLGNVANVLQLTASNKGEAANKTLTFDGTFKVLQTLADGTVNERTMTMPANPNTDTKNTAGATDISTKIFLVGASTQATNPQTYTDNEVFVTNGKLDAREISTSGNATIGGSLTVIGNIITNDVEMISTSNGVIFEGATANAYETTLYAIDPTDDRTIALPDATGTVALTSQIPVVNNGTLTITNGGGITGSGTFTANQSGNTEVTISHANTSDAESMTAGGRTYINSITLDSYGHVTALGTGTETVEDKNTTYSQSWVDSGTNAILRLTAGGSGSGNDDLTLVAGSNITLTPSGDNLTIAATNTYPTAFKWTNGAAAGPTGSLTGTGMPDVSFEAIPEATDEQSGVVTNTTQTFGGVKTFSEGLRTTKDPEHEHDIPNIEYISMEISNTWKANSLNVDGYVSAPTSSNKNKVWKTDADGNPGWGFDANTWNANSLNVAGYVSAPTINNRNKVWKTDANGNPDWGEIPPASTTASGVVTTDPQIFKGNKTFDNNLRVNGILTVDSKDVAMIYSWKSTTGELVLV